MHSTTLRRASHVLVLVLALMAVAAYPGDKPTVLSHSGDTTGQPTYNRAFTLVTLSGAGTDVPYDAFTFAVSQDGPYDIYSDQTAGDFDGFISLYEGSFDPADALANLIALDDDFMGTRDSLIADVELVAGTTYVLVTAGFTNDDFGAFTNTVHGGDGGVDPVSGTEALKSEVEALPLGRGQAAALNAKLNAVLESLADGDVEGAIDELGAFINHVEAQRGRALSEDDADGLIDAAEMLVAQLES